MNIGIIEREMIYAQAKIQENQKPYLNAYWFSMQQRALFTGLFIGFVAALAGILISTFVFANF